MLLKATVIALVMVAATGAAFGQRRVIPVCPKPSDAEHLVGFEIKFIVPKETKVIPGRDIDYVSWAIDFGSGTNRAKLQALSGLQAYYGEPSREDIKASRKFIRRYWSHNKLHGVDARGIFRNGMLWRDFGMFGEVVGYYKVSPDAAAYFDRILETACFLN